MLGTTRRQPTAAEPLGAAWPSARTAPNLIGTARGSASASHGGVATENITVEKRNRARRPRPLGSAHDPKRAFRPGGPAWPASIRAAALLDLGRVPDAVPALGAHTVKVTPQRPTLGGGRLWDSSPAAVGNHVQSTRTSAALAQKSAAFLTLPNKAAQTRAWMPGATSRARAGATPAPEVPAERSSQWPGSSRPGRRRSAPGASRARSSMGEVYGGCCVVTCCADVHRDRREPQTSARNANIEKNKGRLMGVRFEPVLVDTNSPDEEGRLAFWQDRLVAVLVRLSSEYHGPNRHAWFLELSTGPCSTTQEHCFGDLQQAAAWIETRVGGSAWPRCDTSSIPVPTRPVRKPSALACASRPGSETGRT